jgi:hypothetical protein
MEAARTSETSVDNYFTLQYISEDNSELHTRLRENLNSHNIFKGWLQCVECKEGQYTFWGRIIFFYIVQNKTAAAEVISCCTQTYLVE